MTDHEKFREVLISINPLFVKSEGFKTNDLAYNFLAKELGLTRDSVKSMLAPSKKLPKWAKAMIIVHESQKINNK